MSTKRFHTLNCDTCLKSFFQWPRLHIESYGAHEVRSLAHKYGWRFHSGKDVCVKCRAKAKSSQPKAESYETHKTKRRNRYRLKAGIPIDKAVTRKDILK